MAFIRDNDPEMGKYRLLIANSDGGTERTLVSGDHPTPFQPAWSPDGKIIVCIGDATDKSTTELVAIEVETGKQRVFARLKVFREFLANLTWLHDGSGLLVIDNKIQSGRLGFVSYPQGEFKTIATDSGQYNDISLTSNDQTLAAVVANENYHLYVLPASGAVAEAKQLMGLEVVRMRRGRATENCWPIQTAALCNSIRKTETEQPSWLTKSFPASYQ